MVSEPVGHPCILAGQPLDIKVLVGYQPQPLTLWLRAWILTGWLEAWRPSWQPFLQSDEWLLATDSYVLTACKSSAPSKTVHCLSQPIRVGAPEVPGVNSHNSPSLLGCEGLVTKMMLLAALIFLIGALLWRAVVVYGLWLHPMFSHLGLKHNVETVGKGREAEKQAHFWRSCSFPGSTAGFVWDPWFTHILLSCFEMLLTLVGLRQHCVTDAWQNAGELPSIFWHADFGGIIKKLKEKSPY
jgi:hypothetical protein